MSKLHELLAVESDLEGIYKKIVQETIVNFQKHPDRYMGMQSSVEYFNESVEKEVDTFKKLDDTVPSKLDYTSSHVIRYFDAVLQKERTNQEARADIIVDGVTIASDVPATFLLGLEKKMKVIRAIYEAMPTLQPGVHWVEDEDAGKNIYRREHPEEKFRTKKVMKNHVRAVATDKHPAQVDVYTEDDKIARVIKNEWCGMITPAQKSAYIERVDKITAGIKKARQRANTNEVIECKIGKEIFNYINK